LRHQLQLSLSGIKKADASKIVVAYEPVWAVGQQAKGVISPTDLTQSIIFIKKVLTDMFGRSSAERVSVLYGGSVDPNNVSSLMYETGVKGFLVGRVSLQSKYFRNIAESFVKK
jgi:triosephosphate isomerase (TIM)